MITQKSRDDFWQGIRVGSWVIVGFVPVAMAFAIMAKPVGLSLLEINLMSICVFAGASQIMAIGLLGQQVSVMTIILATFLLNLRHIIMSTCVVNKMRMNNHLPQSLWQKFLVGFGITDEGFAIFTTRKDDKDQATPEFYLGIVFITYLSWISGTFLGTVITNFLPEFLLASLGIALYAMFIALLVPNAKKNQRLLLLIICTAILNSFLSQLIAPSWSLIVSTLVGATIGVFCVEL